MKCCGHLHRLRVVQTYVILFLYSMPERCGSDIERLWNRISWPTQNRLKMLSFNFRVVLCRIRLFPTLISKIKWLGSGLPWRTPKILIFPNEIKITYPASSLHWEFSTTQTQCKEGARYFIVVLFRNITYCIDCMWLFVDSMVVQQKYHFWSDFPIGNELHS